MTTAAPHRTKPRRWTTIAATEIDLSEYNPFTPYTEILEAIDATPVEAFQRMWEICENQVTNYTTGTIFQLFISNLTANKKKYDQLIDFYTKTFFPFDDYYKNEEYDHTRTPDLTSHSESEGSGSASSKVNQTRTSTTTPNNYQTETTHKVDPFDETGLRNESQDISIESGSTSTSESYSGDPDLTESTSTAESTVTNTGTETNEYTKVIHGRSGKRPTSEVIEDGLKAASMLDILDIIINDIADQIFLQVWI